MKHQADFVTAELPGLPTMARRGRPCVGLRPMTSAERKRRSRQNRLQAALRSGDVANVQIPVQLNAVVDERTRRLLRQIAEERGVTIGALVDEWAEALDRQRSFTLEIQDPRSQQEARVAAKRKPK